MLLTLMSNRPFTDVSACECWDLSIFPAVSLYWLYSFGSSHLPVEHRQLSRNFWHAVLLGVESRFMSRYTAKNRNFLSLWKVLYTYIEHKYYIFGAVPGKAFEKSMLYTASLYSAFISVTILCRRKSNE